MHLVLFFYYQMSVAQTTWGTLVLKAHCDGHQNKSNVKTNVPYKLLNTRLSRRLLKYIVPGEIS